MEIPKLSLIQIQPSQFYISKNKMEAVKKWFNPNDLSNFDPLPIKIIDGVPVMLNGHTRAVVALQKGLMKVP